MTIQVGAPNKLGLYESWLDIAVACPGLRQTCDSYVAGCWQVPRGHWLQ